MAKFQITGPDGGTFEITAPEGASEKDVLAYAKTQMGAPKPTVTDKAPANADWVTSEMSGPAKIAAGAGAQLTDLWEGAKQMVGAGPTSDEVKERRRMNAPLDATTEGKVGRFAGAVIPFAATSMIPGANTYTGAALGGAAMGALDPVTDDESRLKNAAVGAGTGVIAKAGTDKIAQVLANRLSGQTAQLAGAESRNAVKDATVAEAREAGYVTPPTAVNPSFLNKRLEGIAGKAAVGQEAAVRNQQVTNELARRAIGMADDAPISEGALNAVRKEAGRVYQEVAALDPRAAAALERLKDARAESKAQWNFYNRSAQPDALRAAKAADTQAEILERVIDRAANSAGRPELTETLKDARRLIAKTYDVERALNVATGDVSAPALGQMLDKGKPLTGELATAARFQQAFPAFAREGEKVPAAGVSQLQGLSALGLGAVGGPVAAALPFLSDPVRSVVLSKVGQSVLAKTPSYEPGIVTKALPKIAGSELSKAASRAALVDAILANTQ